MSTNNTVLLHDVTIPALNSVGYADGLHSALESIENNESLLANRDFIKGDRGDSVDIEKIDLSHQEHQELFELLKSTIKGGLDPQPIGGVSWDSLLGTDLYVINKTEIENGVERYVPISSLYYTFVDGRFVNDNVGNLSAEDFADESDLSCILVYEDGKFKKLNNIFPNMYFEDGHGLCWMVNGQRTGLPVQGVPGKDGRNSDILIVKVKANVVDENGKGEVEETWNKLGNWTTIEDKESMDGYSCFALAPTEEGSTSFYAGKLTYEDGVLYVICKPELSLQQTFDTQTFINVMQNISIKPNPDTIATPPGLFVPMKVLGDLTRDENGNVTEDQPVHLMTAASINNEIGDEQDLMTDMVVTPVNTTDLTIDTTHDVKVDKYLYVRMSDEVRPLVEDKMSVSMDGIFTNYKLKFKLSNILLTRNVQRPITEDEKVYFLTETAIDNNGRMDFSELAPYNDHNKMIPADFRDNIDKGIGIYAWSLDLTEDSFDPDNTLYAGDNNPIKDIFPVVYTKTMTPGVGDDILWFNSLIVDEDDFFAEYPEFSGVTSEPDTPSDSPETTRRLVCGCITDENGNPINGVHVQLLDYMTSNYDWAHVVTDEYGMYDIIVPEDVEFPSDPTSIRIAFVSSTTNGITSPVFTLGDITDSGVCNMTFDGTEFYITPVTPARFTSRIGEEQPSMPEVDGDTATDKETEFDPVDPESDPADPTYTICEVCGFGTIAGATHCSHCGEDFSDPTTTVLVCPNCSSRNPKNALTCWNCTETLIAKPDINFRLCPSCLSQNPKGALTCFNCGYSFVEQTPATETTEICPGCGTENTFLSTQRYKVCSLCQYDFETPGEKVCPNCNHHTTDLECTHCENCNYNFYTHVIDEIDINEYTGSVTGYITENGEPVIGAWVTLSGIDIHFQTDVNGYYSLPVTLNVFYTGSINVHYIGYDTRTIEIQGRNRIDVELTDVPEPELPPVDPSSVYKLLRGTDRKSLIFDKFVPIYVNSYRMDRDTSYNLNYNVNITGDEINPKRTLSVYGDINCENINVYELTATGEIKNIYTKNEIVGEDGIDLAKGKFHVDSNGNSTATTVNVNNVSSDSIETTTLTSNSLTVRQIDYNAEGGISKETENIKVYPIDNDHTIDIDVNNVSSISIVGKSGDKANIDSDIPILLDIDSGIYISTNNELVGYKGNTITGKTGYNGDLEDRVKYYVSACEDNSKGKTTNKYSIKNNKSIYRGKRQTSLDGMKSKFGQTYIQVCNPLGYVVDYTFDGSKDNVSTKPITCNTTIDSTTLNIAKSQACCKFYVGNDVKNTSATSFKLKFSKPFVFAVSMNTKCSNGYWTELKTSNSKVVFKVVVVGTDPDDNSTKIWTPTQFECGFGDGNIEWNGYEQTSKTGNSRWKEFVRTRLFAIQPSDKTFDGNYMGYKNLEVYIVPTISMRFETQDDRNLVDYIGCSQFIPYSHTVSSKDKVYAIDINTNPDNIVFTDSYVSDTQKQYMSLDYEYDIEGAGFSAAILDNTGLIYAYGNSAVMGLGYTPKGLGLYFYQKIGCGGTPGTYKSIALTDVYDLLETMASSYNL